MRDIEYTLTGMCLGLILCISECFYFIFAIGEKLNTGHEIVLFLFLVNIVTCIVTVKVLKIETLTYLIDKYL